MAIWGLLLLGLYILIILIWPLSVANCSFYVGADGLVTSCLCVDALADQKAYMGSQIWLI